MGFTAAGEGVAVAEGGKAATEVAAAGAAEGGGALAAGEAGGAALGGGLAAGEGGGAALGGGLAAGEAGGTALGGGITAGAAGETGITAGVTAGGSAAGMEGALGTGLVPGAAATGGGAAATGITGMDVLGTIKTLAPAISAGSHLLAAGAAAQQAKLAKGAPAPGAAAIEKPQASIDPDVAALRKKNALLFGSDSPAGTDLTAGNAETGNLGRVTLLGGTSRLGN